MDNESKNSNLDLVGIGQAGGDVAALLSFTARRASANRAALEAMGDALFGDGDGALSDRERALMINALKMLVREIEAAIRRELAAGEAAARDLADALERDGGDIAYPILARARLLRAGNLVEAVKHRVQTHRLATALDQLRGPALGAGGEESIIQPMVREPSRQTVESLKRFLAAEFGRVDTFQNPLIRPVDLPAEISPKLWWWVSAALRSHAAANYDIDWQVLDSLLEEAPAAILMRIQAEQGQISEADAVIDGMSASGRFSSEALLQLLRQGEALLFEAAFAKATALRPRLVSRLMYEPGGESLAVACKAVGFDRQVFATIFDCTRHALLSLETPSPGAADVNSLFDGIDSEVAVAVLQHWRRDAAFLYAIKQVESL